MLSRRLQLLVLGVAIGLALPPVAQAQYYPPESPAGGSAIVSVGDARVTEGHSGTTNAVFRVTSSSAAAQPMTVWYETWNGSASAPSDFAETRGTVTIPAGGTTASITVPVRGDAAAEPDELFFVHLPTAAGATVSATGHHGTGTIVNDDGRAAADRRAPNTMIHGGPGSVTRSRTASFHLMSTEPRSRFQCKLDAAPWRPCRANKTLRNLRRGLHTFRARAIDAAGNVDPTPARRTWRIR